MWWKYFNDINNNDNNLIISDFKDIYNNIDYDEEENIKSKKELMYDTIQDNYNNMKNGILIFRKRLIY